MKITFITGLPGAGKSTYALGTGCPVTYDLDRLADAMDYKRGTLVARGVASRLLPAIIDAAELEGVPHIQLIRVTPSIRRCSWQPGSSTSMSGIRDCATVIWRS